MKTLIFLTLGIGLVVFLITSAWVGYGVKNACSSAQKRYEGDCVEALSDQLIDEEEEFRTRNMAIWALGQIGDTRAEPILQRYVKDTIPARERLNETISQYELQKALDLVHGKYNVSKVVWQWIFPGNLQ